MICCGISNCTSPRVCGVDSTPVNRTISRFTPAVALSFRIPKSKLREHLPSLYAKWCRADPYDASMANFRLAFSSPLYHPPRPFRSKDEAHMIRRFVFQWWRCPGNKPSGRDWARRLGISNTWPVKLCHEFARDPSEMLDAQRAEGDPKFADLERAREESQEMRRRGELRPLRYKHHWRPRKKKRSGGGSGRFPGA